MSPARYRRARAVLDRRQPDLTVLLDNVHKPHNFSAILRSCDAVGVLEAHAVWPDPVLRPSHHTAGGSARWVRVRAHSSIDRAAAHLKRQGFTLYAAQPGAAARDYRELDYVRPAALVLGAELEGLSEATLALADQSLVIPMHGMVPSLNVSVAAAILLYEAQRQREQAGLYERPRLDPETYRRTLFEWLHPDVADHCRRHGRPYPPLDDEGGIRSAEG